MRAAVSHFVYRIVEIVVDVEQIQSAWNVKKFMFGILALQHATTLECTHSQNKEKYSW